MSSPSDKLRSIFLVPGWNRFTSQLRDLRDADRSFPASLTISDPTDEERRHLSSLLRTAPSRAERLRYDLNTISAALATADLPSDWPVIVEVLFGSIPAATLALRLEEQKWRELWPELAEEFARHPFPRHEDWLEKLRRDGILRRSGELRASDAAQLVRDAARLLCALPLDPARALAHVAADFFGNSHALDPDQTLSNLVLRNLALRSELPFPDRNRHRRELWETYGVYCDALSAPVLTFNLGVAGAAPVVALCASAQTAIQPIHLSTRLLMSTDWMTVSAPKRVFVCENPAIVALAVEALGPRCAPLVCTDGEPKTAARTILSNLRKLGAELWYHGDFDWPGIAIAGRVIAELGARPWRFDAASYSLARHLRGRPLLGTPRATPWCRTLAEHMRDHSRAYDEEALFDQLLPDLSSI